MVNREPVRDLSDIAARASTLWELIASCRQESPCANQELRAKRDERWRERSARLDHQRFETRLSWLGTAASTAERVLGEMRLEGQLPEWTHTFDSAMGGLNRSAPTEIITRQPFGAILFSFAELALSKLPPIRHSLFTEKALDALTEDLISRLTRIAEPALYLEFCVFRTAQTGGVETPEVGTRLYDQFVENMINGGLWDFFSEYSVLARLLSKAVEFWSRNTTQLIDALGRDLPEIHSVFSQGQPPGKVTVFTGSLSDTHDGGRTVSIIEFENGLKLVYKPRDLGIETAWFELLEYLDGRGCDFHLVKVINRGTHGWAELVEHSACRDETEAKQFFNRAGMLLCMLYALEASDCFYENIVACGGYPVLVDMETLMHHVLKPASDLAPAEEIAGDLLFDSVFRAGFLPSWEAAPDGVCVDISGLSARAGQVTPYLRRRWENVNTDAMVLHHDRIVVESEKHLAHLNGSALFASDFTDEIVDGFERMYRLLIELRGELLQPNGLLDHLGRQEIRVVIHATRIYSLLMKRLDAPRHFRSGVDRSIETDIFSRFYLESRERSRLWPVLEAEITSMEQLDIPRFKVRANATTLVLPDGRLLDGAFEGTALDRVRRRLSSLEPGDMETQIELIRASLRVSAISVRHESGGASSKYDQEPGTLLSPDQLKSEARAIAAAIEGRIIRSSVGGATWIAPQLLPGTSHHELRPLRMDMYNGLGGVALFFSALQQISGTGGEVALAALSPLRRFVLANDPARMARQGYTIGAATGVGSFIYVLCRCARFLDEPALLAEAEGVAKLVTSEWIAADQYFDVMSGAAGLIFGLLTLYQETRSQVALEKANLCGRHLLENQLEAGGGRSWPTVRRTFLTGFSHGAAGIALSLLRLHAASGEKEFKESALAAIAFENSVFDEGQGNWPDFRHDQENREFMNAWCHGAAGIGIARQAGQHLADSPTIKRDIRAALSRIELDGLGGKDGLCCGNFGRTEMLISAACAGKDRNPQNLSMNLAIHDASAVVERARRGAGYRLSGSPGQDFFDPSLFQGLSGIGYEMLRIAHPRVVPSVLAWE